MKFVYDYPRPAVAADIIVFRQTRDHELQILLIERRDAPFAGAWALPGGFLNDNETLEQAAQRELREETGLQVEPSGLSQLKAYSKLDRDPRTRVISVVFVVQLDSDQSLTAGDDARDARWFPVQHMPRLAFDHDMIVRDGIRFRHRGQ
jgi:8-oxo-dGTP diphosphatase